MKFEYFSEVNEGKLQPSISKAIGVDLKHFEGKRVHLTIEKQKSKRSHQQNKYWWVCMTILSQDIGYTKEEMHELAKFKFLKREKVIEKTGEIMEYIESTTKLNKTDFADMTSELHRWASESFGIVLPVPGDQFEMFND
jgi:hypothetical protein